MSLQLVSKFMVLSGCFPKELALPRGKGCYSRDGRTLGHFEMSRRVGFLPPGVLFPGFHQPAPFSLLKSHLHHLTLGLKGAFLPPSFPPFLPAGLL